uniref:EKC/KEOPS complex subunit PCC1 n=1 Tax=Caenorhabditis tropicalis TaxID=1561998 RepID=A0A1I7U8E7_9PELO
MTFQKNTFFVRHEFPENHRSDGPSTSSQSAMGDQSSDYQIPEKRRKIEVDLKGKGVEMDAASMSFLMNSVNSFVRKAMEEAPIHDN